VWVRVIARMGLRGEGRLYTPEPYLATKHYARSCQKLSILSSSFIQYKSHITELLDGELTTDTIELLVGIRQAIQEARAQPYKDLAASANGEVFRLLQTIRGLVRMSRVASLGDPRYVSLHSTKALIAFAGLDPKARQSGKSLNSTGRLTKRGSSYSRRSIFIAANVARRYDSQFQALYDKNELRVNLH